MKANCASVFLLLVGLACPGFSQTADSTKTSGYLSGGVTVTNNGISLLPTFMLGKPAVMFDLSVGKGKVSFEPQFRFSLQGKPWSFIFWWRYHAVDAGRFQLNVGAHPAIAFKTVPAPNEVTGEMLVSKRALAGEVVPTYRLTKNVNVGLYYLHAHGFDPGISKATHLLALRAGFSNIPLSKQISLRAFSPTLLPEPGWGRRSLRHVHLPAGEKEFSTHPAIHRQQHYLDPHSEQRLHLERQFD